MADKDPVEDAPPTMPSRPRPGPSALIKSGHHRAASNTKIVTFGRQPLSVITDSETMNEDSPLLQARKLSDEEGGLPVVSPLSDEDWDTETSEESKSQWYLLLLTISGLGLQIAWSVELSNGSPYLLSLGIDKSVLALVWIAGPLSGTLVQPYVGLKSDNCRLKWGKRKPFIVGGGIATIISLMLLSWAKETVGGFLGLFGADKSSTGVIRCVQIFAVLMIYVLDFSINVIQAAIRAFIVDCAPTHQQAEANAWIMRTTGIGNILGYLSGYVNLVHILPFLGDTQFKILCAIACIVLAMTAGISVVSIKERDPSRELVPETQDGVVAFFKSLYKSVRRLPPQITKVCHVQFFAWIGWFPFLFYITTYIGEIYVERFVEENPHLTPAELDNLWEKGTRQGTFALLIFAVTTFISSIFLPLIIAPTFKAPRPPLTTPLTPNTPGSLSASGYFDYQPRKKSTKSRILKKLGKIQIHRLTLRRLWLISHFVFALCTWSTFFIRSKNAATFLVAIIGFPWAVSQWAPFSLISAEISKRDSIRRGLIRPRNRDGELLASGKDDSADQAGVVLGIHNVAIAAPQVIATLVSSIIFKALQKPRGTPGDDSVAWVLRFGGCCAIIAGLLTKRVEEETDREMLG